MRVSRSAIAVLAAALLAPLLAIGRGFAQTPDPNASTSASVSASSSVVAPPSSASSASTLGDLPAVADETPQIPNTLPDGAKFVGMKVASVDAKVGGTLWTKPPAIQAPTVGSTFDVGVARAELARILAAGGFATGSLVVDATPAGVAITYKLIPSRLVRRVQLEGAVLPEDDLRRAADLTDVHDVTEHSLDDTEVSLRAYLVKRGWPEAKVDSSAIETDNPLAVIVDVRIEAGRPLVVAGKPRFVVPKSFDEEGKSLAQNYRVREGDRADEETLDLADRNLTNALRGAGFPSASVSHALTPVQGDVETSATLTVTILAGPKILYAFDGNEIIDRYDLLDLLDLKNEADRSAVHLGQKIEDAYVRRGHLDARATPELLGGADDLVRTQIFHIYEGHLVQVKKRVYPCLIGAFGSARLDEEIDSFLDEALEAGGFGDLEPSAVDKGISTSGDVATGARPRPDVPEATKVYVPDVYENAVEHLRELYRSEGYMFAEISEATLVRARCDPKSQPGACVEVPLPELPPICQTDLDQLPKEATPIPKTYSCVPDPSKGIECAQSAIVVIPVNPGPRSYLWDVQFEGTKAGSPAVLGDDVAMQTLRLGEPLSLKDVESSRRAVLEWYRDEGYAFAAVRADLEYSPDKSRARVRFVVAEGERVTIDRIIVEGQERTLESLIRARMSIREGGIYRANLVRESQERLAQLGVFSSVSIGLANPEIPAKIKSVVVTLVERPAQHIELRGGFSTGEGFRGYFEYGYGNLFGYAVNLNLSAKASYQPFLGCQKSGKDPTTKEDLYDCGTSSVYDPQVVRRFSNQLHGVDRFARRIDLAITLPHNPVFGPTVRTSLELINSLDLYRDFKLDRYSPVLTFAYKPVRWFTATIAGDLEYNDFLLFDKQSIDTFLSTGANFGRFGALLRVPDGKTGVAATRATIAFDFRDNPLNATKNGFFSVTTEYVHSIVTPPAQDNPFSDTTIYPKVDGAKQNFFHLTGTVSGYIQITALPKQPVLALSLTAGGNFNVFDCASNPTIEVPAPANFVPKNGETSDPRAVNRCDTYPDRLFYLGGVDSNRGFLIGQQYPQDVIDAIDSKSANGTDRGQAIIHAQRGGIVFVNPRAELRFHNWKWGGFVVFMDASNSWRDKKNFLRDANGNFAPWRLRYSVGTGLSIDTPFAPIALDLGLNLSRLAGFYPDFDEALVAFNFSIGRF